MGLVYLAQRGAAIGRSGRWLAAPPRLMPRPHGPRPRAARWPRSPRAASAQRRGQASQVVADSLRPRSGSSSRGRCPSGGRAHRGRGTPRPQPLPPLLVVVARRWTRGYSFCRLRLHRACRCVTRTKVRGTPSPQLRRENGPIILPPFGPRGRARSLPVRRTLGRPSRRRVPRRRCGDERAPERLLASGGSP